MSEPSEKPDSLITGLTTVARSSKGRMLIAAAWPYLLAAATLVAGWVGHAYYIEPRLAEVEKRVPVIDAMAADVRGLRQDFAEFRTNGQRSIIRVGRQAAYATAEAEAFEAPGVKAKKQGWAEKYASAYERMVAREGVTPDVAYTALGMQVAVPQ